jgi:hypothetical protein
LESDCTCDFCGIPRAYERGFNRYIGRGPEPPREILCGTRLLWGPGDKIIFLNKLKIVEYTPKKQNKTSLAKAMVPFRDSEASSWLSGPSTVKQ